MSWAEIARNLAASLWASRVVRLMLGLSWLVVLFGKERVAGWIEALGVEGLAALVRGLAAFAAEAAA